ncbi:hypothetical protein HDV57DRAFT_482666 [Trichoderma longibrachiatum]
MLVGAHSTSIEQAANSWTGLDWTTFKPAAGLVTSPDRFHNADTVRVGTPVDSRTIRASIGAARKWLEWPPSATMRMHPRGSGQATGWAITECNSLRRSDRWRLVPFLVPCLVLPKVVTWRCSIPNCYHTEDSWPHRACMAVGQSAVAQPGSEAAHELNDVPLQAKRRVKANRRSLFFLRCLGSSH